MKLRKKLLCHPGDKRHLAEDQGQDTPWGISTHSGTRKSASCCPLRGGGTEEGGTAYKHLCVQQKQLGCKRKQACAETESEIRRRLVRNFRGMVKFQQQCPRNRKGLNLAQEPVCGTLIQITHIPLIPSKPLQDRKDCCKAEVQNKEHRRGDTCNKSLEAGNQTSGTDSANPRKLNPILVVGKAEM